MRLGIAVLVLLCARAESAPSPPTLVPSTEFKLDFPKSSDITLMAVTPDQKLLILAVSRKGPWQMRRLHGWSTPNLSEDALVLSGFPPSEAPPAGALRKPQLLVSPDSKYAVLGLQSIARNRSRAIFHVIDLQSFQPAFTLDTTDHLLTAGELEFDSAGTLFAQSAETSGSSTISHRVATLSLPRLTPSNICTYRGSVKIPRACGTFADLITSNNPLLQLSRQLNFHPEDAADPRMHCFVSQESKDERIALYECSTGHQTWYDTHLTDTRSFIPVFISPVRQIGVVHEVAPSRHAAAALCTNQGKTYLLVLRNHRELFVYPLDR